MDWQLLMVIFFGGIMFVLLAGIPVAFGFMLINFIAVSVLWGLEQGLSLYVLGMRTALSNFFLLPIPMFVLLGEVIFQSGMGGNMLDVVDKWLGRLPGRLGLIAVSWATLLSATTGVNMATAATLGKVLLPEMEKRGYKRTLSLGCIMGPGGLAMIIPPSGLAVLLGALAEIPIGHLLIAGVVPGLLMAALMATYIIGLSWLRPSVAPRYDVKPEPFSVKVRSTVHLIPLAVIIFCVLGIMLLGYATPTEAAAVGAFASFVLAGLKKRLSWGLVNRVFIGTIEVTVMIFMIIAGASTFSQILAYTGLSDQLSQFAVSLPLPAIGIMISMQIVLLFLGCFMDPVSIMMITIPIFIPIARALDFNLIWFGLIMLVNLDVGFLTPPFGMTLFVMKGIAPPDTMMSEIYKAAVPFILIDLVAIVLVMIFPIIALWLPGFMG
jgi:tripartite ATP-independent transporter DctM subunit